MFVGRTFAGTPAMSLPSIMMTPEEMSSNPAIALPRAVTSGFSEATVNGIDWRVYTAIDPGRTVQVSQQVEVREELAADASVQAALPIARAESDPDGNSVRNSR